MTTINSSSDADDPRPWFDVSQSTFRVVVREATGLAASSETDATAADETRLIEDSEHVFTISAEKPEEVHVLAVRMDGELEFVPRSEQDAVYYAHLGFYDPDTDTFDLLTFTGDNR